MKENALQKQCRTQSTQKKKDRTLNECTAYRVLLVLGIELMIMMVPVNLPK